MSDSSSVLPSSCMLLNSSDEALAVSGRLSAYAMVPMLGDDKPGRGMGDRPGVVATS
jgi:hypothetical protein